MDKVQVLRALQDYGNAHIRIARALRYSGHKAANKKPPERKVRRFFFAPPAKGGIRNALPAEGVAEAYHEKRFLTLAKDIKEGRMFMRTKPTVWRCLNCGCLVEGDHAPEMCPACAHPKAYFAELNYTF